jgi:hypothetical protein
MSMSGKMCQPMKKYRPLGGHKETAVGSLICGTSVRNDKQKANGQQIDESGSLCGDDFANEGLFVVGPR